MGLSRFRGRWRLAVVALGGAWRRSMQATRASTGFKGLFAISIFLGPCVQIGLDSCPLYAIVFFLYFYGSLYVLLNFNTGMLDQKKKYNGLTTMVLQTQLWFISLCISFVLLITYSLPAKKKKILVVFWAFGLVGVSCHC
jgi:hypothetical protein